ncbi:hypothetical protein [Cupriavidus nantongensis]|uniref:hypothetical protein n=1 Tax=Cupriavidus nantongensis TaxID=1796606 RepID=UPI00358F24AC
MLAGIRKDLPWEAVARPAGRGSDCRRAHHNHPSADDLVLQTNDVLLATATDPALLREATSLCGELQPGRMTSHHEDLDYMRVFASSPRFDGKIPDDQACRPAKKMRGPAAHSQSPDTRRASMESRFRALRYTGRRSAIPP